MKTISERIKEGMTIRGMRQVDIIEKTGIYKGVLSSYISGRYEPKQKNIYKIAKALNVRVAWLMGYDVPMDMEAEKVDLIGRYLNLATEYSTMLCCNEPFDEAKKENIKSEIYDIREKLGMEKITLR